MEHDDVSDILFYADDMASRALLEKTPSSSVLYDADSYTTITVWRINGVTYVEENAPCVPCGDANAYKLILTDDEVMQIYRTVSDENFGTEESYNGLINWLRSLRDARK